jgi:hypothetical protein
MKAKELPRVEYTVINNEGSDKRLAAAFDILFQEVAKNIHLSKIKRKDQGVPGR